MCFHSIQLTPRLASHTLSELAVVCGFLFEVVRSSTHLFTLCTTLLPPPQVDRHIDIGRFINSVNILSYPQDLSVIAPSAVLIHTAEHHAYSMDSLFTNVCADEEQFLSLSRVPQLNMDENVLRP